jgi:hypothetical protein
MAFDPSTLITLAAGGYKALSAVVVGDVLLACDTTTMTLQSTTVTALTSKFVSFLWSMDAAGDTTGVIVVSADQQFYTQRGWVPITSLLDALASSGSPDKLYYSLPATLGGTVAALYSVGETFYAPASSLGELVVLPNVYNLVTSPYSNFFANNKLVSN